MSGAAHGFCHMPHVSAQMIYLAVVRQRMSFTSINGNLVILLAAFAAVNRAEITGQRCVCKIGEEDMSGRTLYYYGFLTVNFQLFGRMYRLCYTDLRQTHIVYILKLILYMCTYIFL